jgi:hypothetical protein
MPESLSRPCTAPSSPFLREEPGKRSRTQKLRSVLLEQNQTLRSVGGNYCRYIARSGFPAVGIKNIIIIAGIQKPSALSVIPIGSTSYFSLLMFESTAAAERGTPHARRKPLQTIRKQSFTHCYTQSFPVKGVIKIHRYDMLRRQIKQVKICFDLFRYFCGNYFFCRYII